MSGAQIGSGQPPHTLHDGGALQDGVPTHHNFPFMPWSVPLFGLHVINSAIITPTVIAGFDSWPVIHSDHTPHLVPPSLLMLAIVPGSFLLK